jgi:hypothetical protein
MDPETCLNCGATLTGPYCARCGQKRPEPDLTLRELLRETTHELTHWEGKGLPARIFGVERLERAAANSAQLNRAIKSAFPKAMFVLLPLFALLTDVAWRRKMPRYPCTSRASSPEAWSCWATPWRRCRRPF